MSEIQNKEEIYIEAMRGLAKMIRLVQCLIKFQKYQRT